MLSDENKRKIEELKQRRDDFRRVREIFSSGEFYDYVRIKAFTQPNYTPEKLRSLGLPRENIPSFLKREQENNKRALRYFFEQVASKAPYSERLTCYMHKELMDGLLYDAGNYRSMRVLLANTAIVPPDYRKIPSIMSQLETDVSTQDKKDLNTAFHIHYTILTTQPFSDANKRTARLMMNLYLMENGYPPIFVENKDKPEYLSSMEEKFTKSDDNHYYSFMLDLLRRSFDDVTNMTDVKAKHQNPINLAILNSNQNTKG